MSKCEEMNKYGLREYSFEIGPMDDSSETVAIVGQEYSSVSDDEKFYSKEDVDSLIANRDVEIRRLKRALWIARANDASSFASLFSTLSDIEDDDSRTYWIFGNKRKIVIDKLKCHRMETSYTWFRIWDNVADKCLKKAEQYKEVGK